MERKSIMAKKNKMTILDYAQEYHKRGWNIIPIGFEKRPPKGFSWAEYQIQKVTQDNLQEWFGTGKYRNLAVIVGEVSGGLTIIDFDSMDIYEKWKAENPELVDVLPSVKTSRGMHIYCRSDLDKNLSYKKIDVLATHKYALLPPSRHPDGKSVYEWVFHPNEGLPKLDNLEEILNVFTEDIEEIEEKEDIKAIYSIKEIELNTNDLQIDGLAGPTIEKIKEAIIHTLPKSIGERNKHIFPFCRWLKGIPELTELPTKASKPIVKQWHEKALPVIGTKPFTKTWTEFVYGYRRVKWPKGDDTLKRAVEIALKAQDTLPEAEDYDDPEVQLLIRVCYELQQLKGEEPFWLSCHSAGGILGVSHTWANKLLQMLVADEMLEIVENHTTKKATRYRYIGGEGRRNDMRKL